MSGGAILAAVMTNVREEVAMWLPSIISICLLVAATACAPGGSLPQAPSPQPITQPSPPTDRSNRPTIGPATAVDSGATVRSRVELNDPACFYNWDASGRCRFFEVIPSGGGELTVVLSWSTPSGQSGGLMDLFIVDSSGSWTYADDSMKQEKRALVHPVEAGRSYVLIVMAYGEAVDFELTTLM
jgi:hypothetical protein